MMEITCKRTMMILTRPNAGWFPPLLFLVVAGCGGGGSDAEIKPSAVKSGGRVVVYSSLDREFSEPILKAYQKQTGVRIDAKYDVESTKTVGLTQLIAAEAQTGRTRCDLFWNNEVLNTLRLKKKGLLRPIHPANSADYPEAFRDKEGTWYGFAARARVLLVNTRLVALADRPKGIRDLLDPRWKDKIGMAKPLFGTTATHAACLFAAWGKEEASRYFRGLKANGVKVLSGNKQVATAVGTGEIAIGLTDTDDAMGEIAAGSPVVIVYPDREAEGLGTLYIPNTVSVLAGSPDPRAAEALANHLLSSEVETALAKGPSAQIPLNRVVSQIARVETPKMVKPMRVDWEETVNLWDEVMAFLAAEFAG